MHRPSLLLTSLALMATLAAPVLALPPPDEIPEEILRTEVITEARSPLTGEPISAADYAVLQERLLTFSPNGSIVDPDIVQLIYLLQLRRWVRPILPFIP
jgi:hypothetical protein